MAAVLVLTMTACGGGSSNSGGSGGSSGSGKDSQGGGSSAAVNADCVYNSQQIILEDEEEGFLDNMNIDSLAYRDGRLYATGYSLAESDSGSHMLMNFKPDGSDLQYSFLIGGAMDDVISMSIGADGNYYIAKVTYDSSSVGQAGADEGPGAEGPASEEGLVTEEGPVVEEGPAGATGAVPEEEPEEGDNAPVNEMEGQESDAAGPAGAYEDEGGEAVPEVVAEEDTTADSGPGAENIEEFVTSGEDSPANDPTLQDEATNGVTSPADEFKDDPDVADGEGELVVDDVVEVDPSEMAEEGEAVYVLTCISPEGQELWSAPAKASGNAEAEFFVNDIAYSSEGLVVSTSEGLDLYSSADGSFIKTISTDMMVRSATPYVLEDGTVVILSFGNSGEEVAVVDTQTGKLGETYTIPSEVGSTFLFPGHTYQVYLAGTNAVYGMNLDGSEIVKVVDFVDSDMDITAMTSFVEMEDGQFAAVVADLVGNNMVVSLTKVDPEVVANRKTITLGSYYLDYEVRKQVFAFNKQSQDVRVSIVDYAQYNGEAGNEGLTKLNTDIASGSAPDIMVLSAVMPIKSYINKGVFEDLTPYMEADEEISGREYLTNIFDIFKTDGKMYAVIPSFFVNTIVGRTEDIGDGSGFTIDLANQLAQQKGVDPTLIFGVASQKDVLYSAIEMCGDQFIDWDKSECRFDSDEFIKLLEFIGQFPDKIDESKYQEDTTAFYRSGKALFTREAVGSFDEYVNLRHGVFGTEITMAGFPSQNPGTATVFPQLEIAVNASSENKDACWSFVRRFLLDDYQNSISMYWPVSINALDQMANKAMEPLYYTDENGNRVEDHIVMNIGGENIELPRISDTEVDQLYGYLKSLKSEAYYDSSIENIIVEEAAAFFAGQKSARDVAGVIQSRVQIYINENS